MPIYNIGNANISKAYSKEGDTAWSAYALNGNQCHTNGYALSKIPKYFQSETLSNSNTLVQRSKDWAHFVYITDPHGSGNKNHSQDIALYCLNNTPADMIVLGGDYCNGGFIVDEYLTYMDPFLKSSSINNIYAVMGNHEVIYTDVSMSKTQIYNDFLRNKTNIIGDLQNNYYYLDDTTHKIRYMFLNTSDLGLVDGHWGRNMSETQINWIRSNVKLPTSDWHLLVIGHVNLSFMALGDYHEITISSEINGKDIINAIKQCNGHIIGYLCGHQHIDHSSNTNGFYETTIMVDKFENYNYYPGISIADRVTGTYNEQAVSLVSINTKTKNVIISRIGSGRKRTISYTYA